MLVRQKSEFLPAVVHAFVVAVMAIYAKLEEPASEVRTRIYIIAIRKEASRQLLIFERAQQQIRKEFLECKTT